MRIALLADPEIPVPPLLYGGIERIIDALITELKNRGHEVTLFAHKNSSAKADTFYPFATSKQDIPDIISNMLSISRLILKQHHVVHSFGRLAAMAALLPTGIPKIMSYQRKPTLSQIKKAAWLSSKNSLLFTGCSDYITRQIASVANAETVYNAVSTDRYTFNPTNNEDAPLVFLGRIEPIKGAHTAIKVAKETGRKLIIAGNIPENAQRYFAEAIEPEIDNNQIVYMGPVNDEQKNILLGSASALLMPIEWNEPFGIVMAEALACGTPVIAFARGAANEIVKDGVNGCLCDGYNEMISAVSRLKSIDRFNCRQDAENRFSTGVMADSYEGLYHKMCAER